MTKRVFGSRILPPDIDTGIGKIMEEEGWEKSLIYCLYLFQKIESIWTGSWRFCSPPSCIPCQISIDLLFLLRRITLVGKIAHDKFSKSNTFWTRPVLVSLPMSYQDKAEPARAWEPECGSSRHLCCLRWLWGARGHSDIPLLSPSAHNTCAGSSFSRWTGQSLHCYVFLEWGVA